MVAVKAKDVRAGLRNIDDQVWGKMLKDAKRIFEDRGCDLQCRKSHGWKRVRDDDRAMARVMVISPIHVDC